MNPKNQLMLNWHISCLMLYQRVLFARMQMRTDRLKKNDQMGHKLTARSRIGIPARIFLYFFLPWGDTRILFAQLGSWELGVKFAVWQATLTAWQDSETCSLNHWTFSSVSSHQKVHNIYYYMYHYTTEPPLNAMWQMNVKECWEMATLVLLWEISALGRLHINGYEKLTTWLLCVCMLQLYVGTCTVTRYTRVRAWNVRLSKLPISQL